jgi:hypothetical protein
MLLLTVISGFHLDLDEICALQGHYAASSGNPLPTFRDSVSVPSSSIKKSKNKSLKMVPIRCPETSVMDYNSTLHNIPEERRSHAFDFSKDMHRPLRSLIWSDIGEKKLFSSIKVPAYTVFHLYRIFNYERVALQAEPCSIYCNTTLSIYSSLWDVIYS